MTNPTVHVYRSAERGIFVNSFLVEGDDAVVAVDAPLLLSDAHAFRARLDALRKPLAGVLITHPHPDHYNGVTQLVDGHDRGRRRRCLTGMARCMTRHGAAGVPWCPRRPSTRWPSPSGREAHIERNVVHIRGRPPSAPK
jgi:glyoxylase-like metal-dependent hydrolase (beta-lactamase superfamily II)